MNTMGALFELSSDPHVRAHTCLPQHSTPISEPPVSGERVLRATEDSEDEVLLTASPRALGPAEETRYRRMVEEHFDAVWRTLRGVGIPAADADDCAQQVYLVALHRLNAIEPNRERSFLLGTAVRIASNARRGRRRSREQADSEAVDRERDERPTPEQQSDLRERRAILSRILEGMPDELRDVFVLFELEGLTAPEIGEAMGIPVGTASSRLRRAREHFRAQVARVAQGERR